MARVRGCRFLFLALFWAVLFPHPAVYSAQTALAGGDRQPAAAVSPRPVESLWHDPGEISSLDLSSGAGGKEHAPRADARYSFVKEDLGGTSTKFYVQDQNGVEWLVKVGDEARGETAATRFVWAMGYFTDEDYFVPELHVSGMPKLRRHSKSVHPDGTVSNARLKRSQKEEKKVATWAWEENPFRGSRELNGLRVLMALLNNWDLKTVNNKVYRRRQDQPAEDGRASAEDREKGLGDGKDGGEEAAGAMIDQAARAGEVRYVVSDLGASFGRTGAFFSRSKGRVKDYRKDGFIRATTPETVDFVMRVKPGGFIRFLKPGYSRQRSNMGDTVRNIPRADAKWIGQQLARLTPDQIRSAFGSSGFTAKEADGYLAELSKRIAELNAL